MADFTAEQFKELAGWRAFYDRHKARRRARAVEGWVAGAGCERTSRAHAAARPQLAAAAAAAAARATCPAAAAGMDGAPCVRGDLLSRRSPFLPLQTYFRVGRVAGRFYDASGNPTPLLLQAEAEAAAAEAAEAAAKGGAPAAAGAAASVPATAAGGAQQPPAHLPCNFKWSKSEGAEGRTASALCRRSWA